MSRSGFPKVLVIRYADAMTDAPSSVAMDSVVHVDGRWSRASVLARMQDVVHERRAQLARDRYAHPIYPMGYETKGAAGWEMHPMPYVVGNQFGARVEVATDRPGEVAEVLVIRYVTHSPDRTGARIDVFTTSGELAGWVVRMTPILERRVTVGWSIWWRPNNGQPDEFVIDRRAPGAKAALFDDAVRAIVRRYKGWA